MATNHTGSTRRGFNEYYANTKVRWAKGRRAADQSLLVSGMNVVAGNAGPSLLPGDMEVVEVPLAVAKIGQGGELLEKCLGLFMALETKAVKLGVVGVVEFIRKLVCPVFC